MRRRVIAAAVMLVIVGCAQRAYVPRDPVEVAKGRAAATRQALANGAWLNVFVALDDLLVEPRSAPGKVARDLVLSDPRFVPGIEDAFRAEIDNVKTPGEAIILAGRLTDKAAVEI